MVNRTTKCLLCLAGLMPFAALSHAQTTVRIEEDWELHVTHPDEQLDAPQITTMMVPFGNLSDLLFEFDVNHGSRPAFSAGGFQLRISDGEYLIDSHRMLEGDKLYQTYETVRWTQVIQKVPSGYYFSVVDGESESLGSFGGSSASVFISNGDAGIVSLNAYNLQSSLENSGVTYAGNRVDWLKLKKVRLLYSNGQTVEFNVNTNVQ